MSGGRSRKGRAKTGGRKAELLERPDVQDAVRDRILKGDTAAFFRALELVAGKPRQAVELDQDAKIVCGWEGE